MKHKFWSFRFWLHRSHLYITLGIFLFSFLVIYIPLNTSFFDPVTRAFEDFRLSDLFLRLSDRNSMPESNEIFVVDVTSIRNRKAIAETIAEVAATSPKVIALDIMFPDDDRSEDNLILMQTLDTIPATIVTASEVSDDNNVLSSFFIRFCRTRYHACDRYYFIAKWNLREGSYPRPSKGMLQIIRKLQAHFLFVRLWRVFCIAITGFAG